MKMQSRDKCRNVKHEQTVLDVECDDSEVTLEKKIHNLSQRVYRDYQELMTIARRLNDDDKIAVRIAWAKRAFMNRVN